jgi:hypothetical protein
MRHAMSMLAADVKPAGAFSFENISELANKAADEAFRPPASIPDFLKTLSYAARSWPWVLWPTHRHCSGGMFLVFSSIEVIIQSTATPVYFSPQPSLFPLWPIWHPELTIVLLTTIGLLLILPKLLSYALILKRRESAALSGPSRLALGIAIEIVFSTLMAPLRLWFRCNSFC